jgi:hypothetical protein
MRACFLVHARMKYHFIELNYEQIKQNKNIRTGSRYCAVLARIPASFRDKMQIDNANLRAHPLEAI